MVLSAGQLTEMAAKLFKYKCTGSLDRQMTRLGLRVDGELYEMWLVYVRWMVLGMR